MATFNPSIPQFVSVKLDSTNYLLWLSQIGPILRSQELMPIVDGSEKCPPKFITESETEQLNPQFSLWTKKDQFCLSWINSTLSEKALPTVCRLNTAHEVWAALAGKYAAQTRSRIFDLKRRLQTLTQGTRSCSAYLDAAKMLSAELGVAGEVIEDDDLISYVAGGLNKVFNPFSSNVNFARRDKPMAFDTFEQELLSFEEKMIDRGGFSGSGESAAFYSHRGNRGGQNSRPGF